MIREYKNGDALRVVVQRAQKDEFDEGGAGFDQVGAYTQVDVDGRVLAVFGVSYATSGVADCYALMAHDVGRKLLETVRFLQRQIPLVMQQRGIWRVQMTVKKDFLAGRRFAEMLGFGAAEVLPKFYKENDYQLFERIGKW